MSVLARRLSNCVPHQARRASAGALDLPTSPFCTPSKLTLPLNLRSPRPPDDASPLQPHFLSVPNDNLSLLGKSPLATSPSPFQQYLSSASPSLTPAPLLRDGVGTRSVRRASIQLPERRPTLTPSEGTKRFSFDATWLSRSVVDSPDTELNTTRTCIRSRVKIGERLPASTPTGERLPASTPTGERLPASTPTGERLPASTPTGKRSPASTPTGERSPASTPTGERLPASTPTGERFPASTPTVERSPASTPTGERSPASTTTGERLPASTPTGERLPASTSTGERSPASTPTGERLPASTSTGERLPASTPTGERLPASTPTGERLPASTPTGERLPASTPTGERLPASTPTGERLPASTSTGERSPASTPTGERLPASTSTGERLPASTPTGERLPASTPIVYLQTKFSVSPEVFLEEMRGLQVPPGAFPSTSDLATTSTRFSFDLKRKEHEWNDELEVQRKKQRKKLRPVPRITLDVAEQSPPASTLPVTSKCVVLTDGCHISPPHKEKRHSLSGLLDVPKAASGWVQRVKQEECGGAGPYAALAQARRASWHALTLTPTKSSSFLRPGVLAPTTKYHTSRFSSVSGSPTLCPGSIISVEEEEPEPGLTTLIAPPHTPPCRGKILGRGGFGTVKVGCHRGVKVAVKVLRGRRAAATSTHEAQVLALPPSPHLALTHAVVTPSSGQGCARVSWSAHENGGEEHIVSLEMARSMFSFSSDDIAASGGGGSSEGEGEGEASYWAWVVSELCTPFTLLSLINDTSLTLTTTTKIRFSRELSSGLAFLHSHGLVHLDVKPGNALITHQGRLKLSDFGCCAEVNGAEDPVVGTIVYQAPEVLRGDARGSPSDIFSLGITLWHLLTRTCPYANLHPHVVIYQVVQQRLRPSDHCGSTTPSSSFLDTLLLRLAQSCWAHHPPARPSAASLCRSLAILRLALPPLPHPALPHPAPSHHTKLNLSP